MSSDQETVSATSPEETFMKNFSRLNAINILAFSILSMLSMTSWARQLPPLAEELAKTYGLDSFGQVEGLRYTWNAELPGSVLNQPASKHIIISQKWEWDPKTDTVTYGGKDKQGKPMEVTYQHSQLSGKSSLWTEVDPSFVNDEYWLLFPLHVVWDGSATVTDEGTHPLPIAKAPAELLVVQYPKQGGYTPGDTWELFIGPDKRIKEFIYRRGGARKPRVVITTWEGYKKAGPLLFSTDHRGTADGQPVRIYFSDVSVKLTGSDNWINAQ
jgi:hypothetical protein